MPLVSQDLLSSVCKVVKIKVNSLNIYMESLQNSEPQDIFQERTVVDPKPMWFQCLQEYKIKVPIQQEKILWKDMEKTRHSEIK